jgi:hypothetical protein
LTIIWILLKKKTNGTMVVLFIYTQAQAIKGKPLFRKKIIKYLKIQSKWTPSHGRKVFSESAYITTVGTALQEKDYKWAEVFMDVYKEELPPEHRDNA